MRTVIYFIPEPRYIETHLPDQLVKAFRSVGIDAYVMPHHLLTQAI